MGRGFVLSPDCLPEKLLICNLFIYYLPPLASVANGKNTCGMSTVCVSEWVPMSSRKRLTSIRFEEIGVLARLGWADAQQRGDA
jgi:hypothetical protein